MSWEHYHAFLDVFNGTTAERLVLSLFAASCDENGITHPSASISNIARRAGMDVANVRRIVRRYEGEPNGKKEPGKYLYPTGEPARQGQVHVTRYRMPLKPIPGIPRRREPANNPTGVGSRNPPGRVQGTQGVGSRNLFRWVQGTDRRQGVIRDMEPPGGYPPHNSPRKGGRG